MFILTGPTATGKSELAVEVALRCNAEIVGADAFQVYAGLDLLTAKPPAALRARVPHHLIGEIPLGESFDAGKYEGMARERMAAIQARGKNVLICGGTGLYLRALLHGLSELPPGDPEIRAGLGRLSLEELQREYAALDPEGMERIDRKNPRRLIRAIEVSLLTGEPFSRLRPDWSGAERRVETEARGVVLTRPREELHKRIDARVREMFAKGVVEEVRAAGEAGATASQAIGYAEIRGLLRGEMSEAECIAAIQQATRRYAKRQLTWFRREPIFEAIPLETLPPHGAVECIAHRFNSDGKE